MSQHSPERAPLFYEFGPFRLDLAEKTLLRDGEAVPLTLKVFETLLILVERRGHLIGKAEMMQALWPDSFVGENTLTQNISVLRKALGDGHAGQSYIVTLPKRGYRFVAEVREAGVVEEDDMKRGKAADTDDAAASEAAADDAPGTTACEAAISSPRGAWRRRAAWLACALLAATVAAACLGRWLQEGRKNETPKTIAVLPFRVVGGANEAELLGLGMADALSLKLSGLSRPVVLPSSSVFRYAGRDADPVEAGRDLGVDAVLDGVIQRAGARLRVTARLISPGDGRTIWAGKFDESSTDLFSLQDSISEQIAQALTRRVGGAGEPINGRPTRDPDAYQSYLVGLYLRHRMNPDALYRAAEHFRQAVAADANFALAHAAMADCYSMIAALRVPPLRPAEAWERARAAAARAVEIDDRTAEAYTVLAWYATNVTQDYEEARRLHLRALDLKPNHAVGHARYAGLLLLADGRLDEAVARLRRAQELDPVTVETNLALAFALDLARRHDEAVRYSRRALDIDPGDRAAQEVMGLAYAHAGQCDAALAVFRRLEHPARPALHLQGAAYALALDGRRGEAEAALAELTARAATGGRVEPYYMAAIYAALGRKEEAFDWLERVREPSPDVLAHARTLDPLRRDQRFADFVRRAGVTPRKPRRPLDG